jgi:hypothetical protein
LRCAPVATAAGPCTSSAARAALSGAGDGLAVCVRPGWELGLVGLAAGLDWPLALPWPPDELQPAATTIAAAAAAAAARRASRSVRRKADTSVADWDCFGRIVQRLLLARFGCLAGRHSAGAGTRPGFPRGRALSARAMPWRPRGISCQPSCLLSAAARRGPLRPDPTAQCCPWGRLLDQFSG